MALMRAHALDTVYCLVTKIRIFVQFFSYHRFCTLLALSQDPDIIQ